MLETLNTTPQDQDKLEFVHGQQQAMKDKKIGYEFGARNLSEYSKAFGKGYKSVYGGWWDRFNTKLTDFVAGMGSSRLR